MKQKAAAPTYEREHNDADADEQDKNETERHGDPRGRQAGSTETQGQACMRGPVVGMATLAIVLRRTSACSASIALATGKNEHEGERAVQRK